MFLNRLISGLMLLCLVIMIPYFITTSVFKVEDTDNELDSSQWTILLEDSSGNQMSVPLETYLIGVLAAEMPVSFEEEALKAQAVAARTYTIKQFGEKKEMNLKDLNQSYMTTEEMEEVWGVQQFADNYNKLTNAVKSTRGEIITYEEEPIEAVFHSTSAGITQSAENVWGVELPYLKPVESEGDIESPNYLQIVELTQEEIVNAIQKYVSDFQVYTNNLLEVTQVISRTEGGYIGSIQIGNKIFTGEELREYLNLNSSNFTIEAYEDKIRFVCKGYGHGVGLSQYGANYMAKQGATYKEILSHYYSKVDIIKMEEIE